MADDIQINSTLSREKQPKKTAADWVRGLQFSSDVNKSTVGVETDRVTPLLMLAASNKLLKISRGELLGDAKDSLRYQRFYGPVEYFAEHIQRDGGNVARSLLWKATNRGNVDFIGTNALQPHISSVYNESNLSQFVDNSTPLDGIDNSMKVTRVGLGGISSEDVAPIEMRLVQPSYYGYIGPVRTAERSPGITAYLAKNVMKGTDGQLYQRFLNMHTGKELWVSAQKAAASVVATNEVLTNKDKYVYAMGGLRGVHIVPRSSIDYVLPRADLSHSMAACNVPMLSGIKAMRLLMGCLHPDTPVIYIDDNGYTNIVPAKRIGHDAVTYLFGCDKNGKDAIYKMSSAISRFPDRYRKFKKVVLSSGRVLPTSPDHKWYIRLNNLFKLITADNLKEGMSVPRSTFSSMPVRLTTIMGKPITKLVCILFGRLLKSLLITPKITRFTYICNEQFSQLSDIKTALDYLGVIGYNIYNRRGFYCVSLTDDRFLDWLDENCNIYHGDRRIPSCILSLPEGYTSVFLDSYCKDVANVGEDNNGDIWLLDIPSAIMRDDLSFMLSKIYTDTLYRDSVEDGKLHRALLLKPMLNPTDVIYLTIVKIVDCENPPIMIDIDCGDNVYAAGNGIITHNSKYALQAVPLQQRLAAYVRSLDEASGEDMDTIIGRKLGTQWAKKDGMVAAVRKDRIDMIYDDGSKGAVYLYNKLPANAKGWLLNYPKVKAGQKVKKGLLLATSNYTDDNGVSAMGRNLRVGYMSYQGGTYLDGCAISEDAAKKMAYTTMYKTGMDKDRSIRNSKSLYNTWKPGLYSKLQMLKLDDRGIVKVGQTVNPGDPLILGIQTTEPSPGTMGKRLLTDVSLTWEHANPGVVTDVVSTNKGIRVYATVSSPLKVGDKMSARFGNKSVVAQVIPTDQMPQDAKGRPLDVLMDPLGIVSRTNVSALMLVGLGKVALKTGIPQVMPLFMPPGLSRLKYVKDLMKKNNLQWKLDVYDPLRNKKISNVFTGSMYFLPLKHIADTKMSARGTGSVTALQIPSGGGEEGCFPHQQLIFTDKGLYPIGDICQQELKLKALTQSDNGLWIYKPITDYFTREAAAGDVLDILLSDGTHIYPTKNHHMYKADGTIVEASQLKIGDKLAGNTPDISVYHIDIMNIDKCPVYDITVEDTHNYVLSGGVKVSNSKRLGSLETAALVGHNAFNFLTTDSKLIRGQANSQFWRSIRTGQIPVLPDEPLVHKKFFAHLQGSGMRIKRTNEGISIFALTNKDVRDLANLRLVKTRDTYLQKNFRPIDGGLFGTDVFGQDGKQWGYIKLDEPLPNPVMLEPLARLLNMSDKLFVGVVTGKQEVNGMKSTSDIKAALLKIDLKRLRSNALKLLKEASPSTRDKALKKYVAIAKMELNGVQPALYMLDRIPVLPPLFRPVSSHSGLTMVADSNYLYAQLLDARNDYRDSKDLPEEYQQQARLNMYKRWQLLVGLNDPYSKKLQSKNVRGLLKWALGNSQKTSAFSRKVLGSTVDTVGRGVVVPDSRLKLNQIGMPELMAWKVYEPFAVRKLVAANYTPMDAMKAVKEHSPAARSAILLSFKLRPVVMNRAPSLHKLSLMGFDPVLVSGHAIHVNPSICSPFQMDFDGDSIWNTVLIWCELGIARHHIYGLHENRLTFDKSVLYYIPLKAEIVSAGNNNEVYMISNETKIKLVHANCSLSQIPVVEGSAVQKSETVTEWDVKGAIFIDTVNPETGKREFARMTKVSRHTGLKMYDCTLGVSGSYSHVVTASEDHSLITLNPSTLQLEKSTPMDSKGRLVPRTMKDHANDPDNCYQSIKLYNTYPTTYKMGMFIGMMIGDGWIDVAYNVRLACCDKSLQDYFTNLCDPDDRNLPFTDNVKLFSYAADPKRFSQNERQLFHIKMKHEDAVALKDLIGSSAENKQIPAVCLSSSRAHMIGLLCGLLATDGHIGISKTASKKATIKNIAYHTTSPTLRDQIQLLCLKLGVKTRATPYMGANSTMTCYEIGFCLEDIARLKKEHEDTFVIPVDYKEAALKEICAEIGAGVKNSYDLVPFPRGLFCEYSFAGVTSLHKSTVPNARAKGYIKRSFAKDIADHMEKVDWSIYKDPTWLKEEGRTHHTPEEAKQLVDKWIAMVRDESIGWEVVDDVTPSTITEGWDCTVPGPYTFSLSTGTVVQDTVNLHVPVTKAGIKDVRLNMMPEKNLISMRKGKILYPPEKAYTQGIYVATRMGLAKGKTQIFDSLLDARKAYRRGLIDIDTPIVLRLKK